MRYTPWTGKNYEEGYRHGLKILIMGHSHYEEGSEGDDAYAADFTKKVLADHINARDGGPYPFFCFIEQIFTTKKLSESQERQDFWSKVAFSNYLQDPLDKAGTKASTDQLRRAEQAFPKIIDYTKPNLMCFFSREAWLLAPGAKSNLFDLTDDACYWPSGIIGAGFAHSRNRLVSVSVWHVWLHWLLTKALDQKNAGAQTEQET